MHTSSSDQSGTSLIEILFAISLFAIIGLGVAQSAQMGMLFQKRAEIGDIAKNLAISKAESLSGIDINLLTDTYDQTESNVVVSGHKIAFTRVTNITVNADNSRTIQITISSTSNFLPVPISYSTRFAPWEA